MSGLPAVVSILQLNTGTLSSAAIVPASMTVAGVATTLGFPISQIMTTIFGGLPTGGNTGQILNKTSAGNYSTQWSNVTQFVAIGTGLATSGSATSIVVSFATQTGLSVLGVTGTAAVVPAAIVGAAAQVLVVNDAGTGVLFGRVNLASSAAVTGVLPGANMTAVNLAASGPGGVQGILPIPNGGSNTSIMTAWGAVYANNTSSLGATAAGTTGWPLLGNGSSLAPSFQQLNLASTGFTGIVSVPIGGTNTSTLTALGVLFGNGTSTVGITAAPGTSTLLASSGTAPFFTGAPTLATSLVVPLIKGGASSTSTLLVNNNAVTSPVVATGSVLSVIGVDASTTILSLENYGTLGNEFIGRAAKNTAGGPAALGTTSPIVIFGARGYTGSGFATSNNARIGVFAAEQWNATSFGTFIDFDTTAVGTTTRANVMRIGAGVAIGTTTDPGAGNLAANMQAVVGGYVSLPTRQLVISSIQNGQQPAIAFFHNAATTSLKSMGFFYDGSSALTFPGMVFQRLSDTGSFLSNSMVFWGDGGITAGDIVYPGSAGALRAQGNAKILASTALSSTAAAALLCGNIASFGIWIGTGVPAVNAGTGSLFLRNDGATNTSRMYVNINGTGTWTAVNTVA